MSQGSSSSFYVRVGHRKLRTCGIFVDELRLNDRPELAVSVKVTIQELVETHLNAEEPFPGQHDSRIKCIRRVLRQSFPDIFLDAAIKKSYRRRSMRRAIEYTRHYFQRLRVNHEFSDEIEYRPYDPNDYATKRKEPQLSNERGYHTSSSASENVAQGSSSISASTSNRNLGLSPSCNVNEVTAFLRSCRPPMDFLLDSFLAFGCRNREYLAAVAEYDDDMIEELLRKLLRHAPPGRNPGEMEVWILKKHFKHYFPS